MGSIGSHRAGPRLQHRTATARGARSSPAEPTSPAELDPEREWANGQHLSLHDLRREGPRWRRSTKSRAD